MSPPNIFSVDCLFLPLCNECIRSFILPNVLSSTCTGYFLSSSPPIEPLTSHIAVASSFRKVSKAFIAASVSICPICALFTIPFACDRTIPLYTVCKAGALSFSSKLDNNGPKNSLVSAIRVFNGIDGSVAISPYKSAPTLLTIYLAFASVTA